MAAGLVAASLSGCATPPAPVAAPTLARAAPARPAAAIKPFSAVAGKWHLLKSTATFADGSSRPNITKGKCALEIKADLVISVCSGDGKPTRVVTRVHCPEGIQSERLCDSTVIENALRKDFVGHQSKVAYRVEGGKLLVSAYPVAKPGAEKLPVSVVSVLARD